MRFPEFTGEWEVKKLGEVASIIGGGTPDTNIEEYWNGDIQWFTPTEIKSDYIAKSNRTISELGLKKSSAKLLRAGTILLTTRATIGEVAIATEECTTNQGFQSLVVNKDTNSIFISNWIKQNKNEFVKRANGSTFSEISKSEIEEIPILVPLFLEQTKIASFLSLIDERIAAQIKIIEGLKELKASLSNQIFRRKLRFKDKNGNDFPDWEERKLGEITRIYDGTHQTPNYVEKGIPFYSVEQVTSNNFENTKFISQEVFESEKKRVRLEYGDILMTRIGDIGTIKYINWDVSASFYVSLALIKCTHNNINSLYLSHFMRTTFFQNELWQRTIHVAFPQKINLGEIGDCKVLIPSLPEQIKIASILLTIDEKIETEKNVLERDVAQKKFLLKQMFI